MGASPTLLLKQLRTCKPSRPPSSCHASLQPSLLGPCHRMLLPPLQTLLLLLLQLLMLPPLLLRQLLPLLMLLHLLLRQLLPLLQNNSGMILLFDEYSLVLG